MKINHNWIKMGFKICKILFVIEIILSCLYYNDSKDRARYYESFNFNKTLGVTAQADKKEEEKPVVKVEEPVVVQPVVNYDSNIRKGQLTGYGADCPMCNGTLSCAPSYNVYRNGVVTYPDPTYGDVRIVASSKRLSCGSIISFDLSTISNSKVYAIVLDRGVLGNDIDLLMTSEQEASLIVGRRNITYEVLRYGW